MMKKEAMNNIKAVIFDMDGLLLDTERVALSTFVAACRKHDFEPDVNIYYKCIGTNDVRTKEILLEGYGRDFPYEAINELWRDLYHIETWEKPISPKAGALNLLQHLEQRGMRRVVVTSSHHSSALKKLANCKMLHYFDFVLGGDQVKQGKPHPEMYLTACARLGEEPAQCLALEDSDNGVRSATSAGLVVIQVPDLLSHSPEVKAFGHRIVRSLTEVETMMRRSA